MSSRSPSAAPQRAPTLQRIDVARQLLLTPFGLDESHLARALAEIRTHQVDDADLYFQYTRSEGWSLEEGIVKTGSFSIDQGVGCAPSAAKRRRLPIPTTSPKPRCLTRRELYGRFRL
jgi:TldD protein